MDDAAIEKLASATAKATVKETFIALGVDMNDPIGVQRDFAWLRTARSYTSLVRRTAIVGVLGLLGGLWMKFGGGK